jgi:hypothetical protein
MSRSWSFTLNNYTQQDLDRLSIPIEEIYYLVYGKEVGTLGPFLQGTFVLKDKEEGSIPRLRELIGLEANFVKVGHFLFSNIRYCKKDNDFTEWGYIE